MITINMSEFQEAHTVSSLKGAPPGYVGYGEGGRLTEAVRRKPYSVILLDEVEKAHPDVHEIFFQVFDKGIMEDGNGRRIDFKNTLIILTTNVGTDIIMELSRDPKYRDDPEQLALELRPELLKVFPAGTARAHRDHSLLPAVGRHARRHRAAAARSHRQAHPRQPRRRIRLRRRGGRSHRLEVQRSGFGRPHDRQHHHQHAAAGAIAGIPHANLWPRRRSAKPA